MRLLLISALLLASPAAAQVAMPGPGDEVRTLNGLGRCLAGRRTGTVQRTVDLPYGSAAHTRAVIALLGPEQKCLTSDVSFDLEPEVLAGGLAEGLLLARYSGNDLAARVGASTTEPRNGIEDLGQCVVRRNPAAVRALIDSEPASATESKLLSGMVADIGQCVTTETELKLSKPRMRALLSSSLYRVVSG